MPRPLGCTYRDYHTLQAFRRSCPLQWWANWITLTQALRPSYGVGSFARKFIRWASRELFRPALLSQGMTPKGRGRLGQERPHWTRWFNPLFPSLPHDVRHELEHWYCPACWEWRREDRLVCRLCGISDAAHGITWRSLPLQECDPRRGFDREMLFRKVTGG